MSRSAALLLVALSGAALLMPAEAAQWKWREANGRIVYSDRPPPVSIPDKAILQRPRGMTSQPVPPSPTGPSLVPGTPAVIGMPVGAAASAAAGAASAPAGTDPALEAKRRQELQAQQAASAAAASKLAAARTENCSRARGQLKVLDDGVRIARTNEKGEREILDDKARAAEQARLRAVVAADCAPAAR
ncbi:DUF4124 domain-containing protein [Piscinibacter sakaiensis]|uniref:Putative transmembrane protein n=1 Tax=Piscinibacter sakaiensis TaxID=1547922 RepID=A0A0K8P6U1_PISS1|nr:DUF4124 domain-containing protein [Piscinibacter sakaiensis]GAP38331.1 putative transmembrane protein [Piscinibacter sakaiensis]